ncbi:hypothetical protein P153DRAFT_211291 [Dothidotthia symphoricarpi CBS 119687]|uniref:Rhodopsin domain-containing protein n=1 Tax=Dothidotthia symphoricarpi CBS 119687 TaxID=1392245 RepID=A0A6A6AGJ3_9PLEO|nr:uncharacterized protein P153DRAFT_211291 [Dothidotthia symphoricarpi CBS 119687]KAF2131112.1 hypothetical protein P153DRAFT_211291 [Dothidotthia symphoricarpi CBS 119687]
MRNLDLLHPNLVHSNVSLAETHWYIPSQNFIFLFCQTALLIDLTAYCCIYLAIALCITVVFGILLHCRPVKWNWTPPFENSGRCFKFRPFIITIAAVGVAIDCVTWMLPHWVVWNLQLRPAHKVAITAIFALGTLNVVMGGFRLYLLDTAAYENDVTYGISITLMWALAHTSTAIVVACCPQLRPVFEKFVPKKLTRIVIRRPHLLQARGNPIRVTIRIDIHDNFCEVSEPASFHDGHQEPWAPTFEVERGPATDVQDTIFCCGCLTRRPCCV